MLSYRCRIPLPSRVIPRRGRGSDGHQSDAAVAPLGHAFSHAAPANRGARPGPDQQQQQQQRQRRQEGHVHRRPPQAGGRLDEGDPGPVKKCHYAESGGLRKRPIALTEYQPRQKTKTAVAAKEAPKVNLVDPPTPAPRRRQSTPQQNPEPEEGRFPRPSTSTPGRTRPEEPESEQGSEGEDLLPTFASASERYMRTKKRTRARHYDPRKAVEVYDLTVSNHSPRCRIWTTNSKRGKKSIHARNPAEGACDPPRLEEKRRRTIGSNDKPQEGGMG